MALRAVPLLPCCLQVINPTIQYALYEYLLSLRSALRKRGRAAKVSRPGTLEVFLLSALAKAGATVRGSA